MCHPFKVKMEACFNCWKPGHRADVCPLPLSHKCHRCGEAHQIIDQPVCEPKCILCNGLHFTGSKNCKVRFERAGNPKPSRLTGHQQPPSITSVPPEALNSHDSRSKFRSSSKTNSGSPSRSRSRSTTQKGRRRSRSSSFPPLPGRKDQPAEKQVSWKPRSPSLAKENAELRAQLLQQSQEIAELKQQLQLLLKRDLSIKPAESAAVQTQMEIQVCKAPIPPQSASSTSAASPVTNPPQKRKAQSESEAALPMETDSLTAITAAIQSMQANLIAMQKDNTAWMTNISNRLTALEQRQGTQEATMSQMQTQLNGLLCTKPPGSARAEQPPLVQHGCTP